MHIYGRHPKWRLALRKSVEPQRAPRLHARKSFRKILPTLSHTCLKAQLVPIQKPKGIRPRMQVPTLPLLGQAQALTTFMLLPAWGPRAGGWALLRQRPWNTRLPNRIADYILATTSAIIRVDALAAPASVATITVMPGGLAMGEGTKRAQTLGKPRAISCMLGVPVAAGIAAIAVFSRRPSHTDMWATLTLARPRHSTPHGHEQNAHAFCRASTSRRMAMDSIRVRIRSVLQSETGVQRCAAMMVEHSDPGLPGFSSLRTRRSTFGAPLPVLRSWRPKMNVERPGIWGQSQPNKPTTNNVYYGQSAFGGQGRQNHRNCCGLG